MNVDANPGAVTRHMQKNLCHNVEEKLTVILYIYIIINRHAGTQKNSKNNVVHHQIWKQK